MCTQLITQLYQMSAFWKMFFFFSKLRKCGERNFFQCRQAFGLDIVDFIALKLCSRCYPIVMLPLKPRTKRGEGKKMCNNLLKKKQENKKKS